MQLENFLIERTKMSTRSYIGIVNPDETVNYIYCHWDGYLSNNGVILNEHYQDEAKIHQLMIEGDASYIKPEIGTKHNFEDVPGNQCTFYRRDRGEDIESRTLECVEDFPTDECAYLFQNGQWLYFHHGWKPLADCLKEIEKPNV